MYHDYSLNLTQNQKKKIANAYKSKTSVSVRLTHASLQTKGNVSVQLTSRQINRINKSKASGHGIQVNFSKTQLQKQGGFLSSLLNLGKLVLPFLAKKVLPTLGLAAASGAIQGATNKAVNK